MVEHQKVVRLSSSASSFCPSRFLRDPQIKAQPCREIHRAMPLQYASHLTPYLGEDSSEHEQAPCQTLNPEGRPCLLLTTSAQQQQSTQTTE